MNRSYRHLARRLAPATAIVVAAGVTAAVHANGAAAAAPPLALITPATSLTMPVARDDYLDLEDLGVTTVANEVVEVRTVRGASYRDPLVSTLTVGEGSEKRTVTLPSNLVTRFGELSRFFAFTVTDKDGKVVEKGDLSFCPNTGASRWRVDGPPTSPYSKECTNVDDQDHHPFVRGLVYGIQRDWAVPALYEAEDSLLERPKNGTYTVDVAIRKDWRTALRMTLAQSRVSVRVKVVTGTNRSSASDASASGASAPARTGHHHGDAAAGSSRKGAGKAPRDLGRPYTPAAQRPAKAGLPRLRAAATADLPKPDLRPLPAYDFKVHRSRTTKKSYLGFSSTVWNAGPSPLVVDGFRPEGSTVMDGYQYFFDTEGNQVGYAPAGKLDWDPRDGHNHWHFRSFATYRLLDSTKKKAVVSGKEAFCLAATDKIDLTVKGSDWHPETTDLDTACGDEEPSRMAIREVLEAGWGDTYDRGLPGQSVNITKVPNGVYHLQVVANPDRKLTESSYTNNKVLRKVKIGGTLGGKRTVKVYPYQGITTP